MTVHCLTAITGRQTDTAMIVSLRIDADYVEPNGGFHPIKTTYRWQERGEEMQHTHVAKSPSETYVIRCNDKRS